VGNPEIKVDDITLYLKAETMQAKLHFDKYVILIKFKYIIKLINLYN